MITRAKFVLPYPAGLSVNKIWKFSRNKVYLNPLVKKYRDEVYYIVKDSVKFGKMKVELTIDVYPPDRRIRDIDNILKVIFDSLQYARVYDNDSQIKRLTVEFHETVIKSGKLGIMIQSLV